MVLATKDRTNGSRAPGMPEDRDRKPTIDDIMTLFTEGQSYFQPFYAQCKKEEDYYMGRRQIPVPKNIDPVWPATSTAIVNVATDHVDVNNLSIDVPAGPRARARAERIKKFYQGVWLSIKKPILRSAVRHSFLYGIGWVKTMFDADRWPNAPIYEDFNSDEDYKSALKDFMEKRSLSFPFEVEVVNPRNLIWDDSRTRAKWAIEFTDRNVDDVKRRYPEWMPLTSSSNTAQWIEYWDDEWVAYIADQQFVWGPERHSYGYMPYSPIIPMMSYTFQDGPPQERYRGILLPIHSLLDSEARLASQAESIVRQMAWRTLDFSGPRAAAEDAAENYELFGGKNVLPPGVAVGISPTASVPPDVFQWLNIVQTWIEQATFPNVIRGVRPKGVSTGFGISVLAGMGRLVFQGVADGVRHTVEQANAHFAMLVENKLKGRVTVHARTDIHNFDQSIGPDDIRGYYENTVQVKAEAPEEREREALLALRLHQAGVISLYEAQRRAGIINPLEEQMQIRAEMLTNSPEVLQAQTQMLLQQIALPSQQAAAISPTGAPPPEMSPPGVNPGSQNIGGAQLQRPGERMMQQARVASNQATPSVYPEGFGGIDSLGNILGGPTGGAQGMPSGQTVR